MFLAALPYLAGAAFAVMAGADVLQNETTQGTIKLEQSQNNLELAQENESFSQKTLANIMSTQQVLSQQATSAVAMGESLGSGSVQALSLNAFQKGKEEDKNLDLEKNIANATAQVKAQQLDQQKEALPWQLIGSLATSAASAGDILSNFGKK
jgi:hypothetical protein